MSDRSLYGNTPPTPEPPARQPGWDRADWTCGRCYTTVTETTEDAFVRAIAAHRRTCVPAPRGSYR